MGTKNSETNSSWLLNWISQFKLKKEKKQHKENDSDYVNHKNDLMDNRPSITISTSSRRNSQQTVSSTWSSISDNKKRYKFSWPYNHSPRRHELIEKRQSMSSNNSIFTSQPASPNFTALITNDLDDDDDDLDDMDEYDNSNNERWTLRYDLIKLAVDGPNIVTQLGKKEKWLLQLGCGNAAWSIEIASMRPAWMVLGMDYNEMLLPKHQPKNFRFIPTNNLIRELKKVQSESIDFISCRFLMFDFTFEGYKDLINECTRVLRSDGYIEMMELDLRIYYQTLVEHDLQSRKLNNLLFDLQDIDPRIARKLVHLFNQTEYKMIEKKYISLPLGTWGGKLGVMFKDDIYNLYERLLCQHNFLLDDKELNLNRAFMNLHVIIAQKQITNSNVCEQMDVPQY